MQVKKTNLEGEQIKKYMKRVKILASDAGCNRIITEIQHIFKIRENSFTKFSFNLNKCFKRGFEKYSRDTLFFINCSNPILVI